MGRDFTVIVLNSGGEGVIDAHVQLRITGMKGAIKPSRQVDENYWFEDIDAVEITVEVRRSGYRTVTAHLQLADIRMPVLVQLGRAGDAFTYRKGIPMAYRTQRNQIAVFVPREYFDSIRTRSARLGLSVTVASDNGILILRGARPFDGMSSPVLSELRSLSYVTGAGPLVAWNGNEISALTNRFFVTLRDGIPERRTTTIFAHPKIVRYEPVLGDAATYLVEATAGIGDGINDVMSHVAANSDVLSVDADLMTSAHPE